MSQFFPPSWPKSGDGIDGVEILRSSPMSLYSTCSSEEADVFTSSDSDDAETDESTEIEQEGESKLTISEWRHFPSSFTRSTSRSLPILHSLV